MAYISYRPQIVRQLWWPYLGVGQAPPCRTDQALDPATNTCVCPPGTFEGSPQGSPEQSQCIPTNLFPSGNPPPPPPVPAPSPGPPPTVIPPPPPTPPPKPTMGALPWVLGGALLLGVMLLSGKGSRKRNPRRRRCPVGTQTQTLVFEKDYFNRGDATHWARSHGYRVTKIDETTDSYRIRQQSPRSFTRGSFRTIPLSDGIKAVIACPRR